jgi:hypothetical protein
MKNVPEVKVNSTFFSWTNPQYIHILIECFLLIVIVMYMRRNFQRLQNQIQDLKSLVKQQQETLHLHQQLLQIHYPNHMKKILQNESSVEDPYSNNSHRGISPQLPPFETIATFFTVPMNQESTDPVYDSNLVKESDTTTILCPDVVSPVNDTQPKDETIPSDFQIEKEIANEIQELKEEENRQQQSISSPHSPKSFVNSVVDDMVSKVILQPKCSSRSSPSNASSSSHQENSDEDENEDDEED